MLPSYSYPFSVEPYGEGGFMASFRDAPEALTEARSLEGLPAMALDALITAIDFYAKDRRKIPAPSSPLDGEMVVTLPPSVVSKELLLNSMIGNRIRPLIWSNECALRDKRWIASLICTIPPK